MSSTMLAPRPVGPVKGELLMKESKSVDARVLKKREADRKCQRKIREKQKARVASLEQTVEELKQRDTSGQVDALLKKLAEKTAEIDALHSKVQAIQAVLSDDVADPETAAKPTVATSTLSCEAEKISRKTSRRHVSIPKMEIEVDEGALEAAMWSPVHAQAQEIAAFSSASPLIQQQNIQPLERPVSFSVHPDIASLCEDDDNVIELPLIDADPIIPAPPHPCDCTQPSNSIGAPTNIWRFANETLCERFQWPSYYNRLDDTMGDDVPVRAVVEGWDAVERRGPIHPSWQILKKIDQGIFWSCNPRERLAILHMMHMLFESHSDPDKVANLPDFYLKRSSEEEVHSYAINYFTWPGLRERFIRQQHRYCTNDFWKVLTQTVRVLWPYEFRDCYTRNIETGSYTISSLFRERLTDIRTWTVGSDMIQRWPEFSVDIPVFDSIPAAITPAMPMNLMRVSSKQQLSILRTSSVDKDCSGGVQARGLPNGQSHAFTSCSPMHVNPTAAQWDWTPELTLIDNHLRADGSAGPVNLDHFAALYT